MTVEIPQKTDIDSLKAGRQLDALVEERVMGREVWVKKGGVPTAWKVFDRSKSWRDEDNREAVAWTSDIFVTWAPPDLLNPEWRTPEGRGYDPVAYYSHDPRAAAEMEKRIKELGLLNDYIWELLKLDSGSPRFPSTIEGLHILLCATLEQRCRAALKVLAAQDVAR